MIAIILSAISAFFTVATFLFLAGNFRGTLLARLDALERHVTERHAENSQRMNRIDDRLDDIERSLRLQRK